MHAGESLLLRAWPPVQPGDLIQSRYRLNKLLGSGASGSVWSAKNELIDRDVALKIMRPDVAEDAVALQRFFNEAKASGRVRSTSIVQIFDLGQAEDGSPFLVFELLEGEGLDARLARDAMVEAELGAELFVGAAKALHLAHQQGIIHRDLKPANIFLHRETDGRLVAKILDFGISKVFESGNNFTLTRTGTVVGSPAYMAPEQASGREDLDGRADVWALGVVMYEALSGTLPHEAPNYNALMVRILTQDVDPIATRNKELPPGLAAVVDQCLRRDRDERIPTAGSLAAQLETALAEIRSQRYGNPDGPRYREPGSPFGGGGDPSEPTTVTRRPNFSMPPAALVAPRSNEMGPTFPQKGIIALAAGVGVVVGLVTMAVAMTLFR
jgi:serine/threonine protein kinase